MDDHAKQASSYQLDQEILDARGINMKVEEVAGLPTCKYSERVQSLNLNEDDLIFLKGLRRRIKNRLASQNSRRRSMEQLRRLTRELRAVRACRDDALAERRAMLSRRERVREQCVRLREYIVQVLNERLDTSPVPTIETDRESHSKDKKKPEIRDNTKNNVFECRIDKLVQQSVNHIYKEKEKKVNAKTVFIESLKERELEESGVLNLCVKERRSHGRKQPAPRRIAYVYENDDGVLDLKIKKDSQ